LYFVRHLVDDDEGTLMMVLKCNFVVFVLDDDVDNHHVWYFELEFVEEIIKVLVMLLFDGVLQQMSMQLLDEVSKDLLDDDF